MSELLFSIDGAIARVTLNRPEKRNALNDALVQGLKQRLREAVSDEKVKVIVISGAGNDFCSGADLSALRKIAEGTIGENREDAASLMELFALIRRVEIPVIAAVRGKALAGGCGLATACDVVVAAESAKFGYPEVKLGFVPAMVMAILKRNVSEKRAFELITRGNEIEATVAERIGLINHVYADDEFDSELETILRGYAKASRSALSLSKRLLYQMDGMNFDGALRTGVDINAIARMTEDCKQGIARFLAK